MPFIVPGFEDFDAVEQKIHSLLESRMPALPYHNLEHIRDVVAASQRIAIHEKKTAEEMKQLKIAAWFHDAGFMESGKDHEEYGAKLARELLPSFGFDSSQVRAIEQMILATRLPQSPTTDLEKILCDADLDYLGRDDFYDLGNRLYIEMKNDGLVETEREWNVMQRIFLQSHTYYTTYSKLNREPAKQRRIAEISESLEQANLE